MTQEVNDNFYELEIEKNLDDILAEELEKIDQDIPVEVETAPYLLSQEEEKQLEKLLNKKKNADFIMQTGDYGGHRRRLFVFGDELLP